MPTIYPPLRMAADSAFEVNTAGLNSKNESLIVNGITRVPFNASNSTAFASVAIKGGAVTMPQTPMIWTPAEGDLPERWALTVPSTACRTGLQPWVLTVWIYDLNGPTGDPLATFYRTILEAD